MVGVKDSGLKVFWPNEEENKKFKKRGKKSKREDFDSI